MPKLRVIIKPPPEPQGDAEQQTAALRDYLLQMSEELAYVLTHLEADNINDSTFERIQSMIPRPYTGLPVMDGDASSGQSEQWARGDHRHPHDTRKADVTALATETAAREAHEADKGNPHEVTKAQVGLGNVANERQYSAQNPPPIPTPGEVGAIPTTEKGSAGGVAELDSNGMVPSAQLPSYVDDVLEYASLSVFPTAGESGKIYVALDTGRTYRWSGSAYVEISESLALGETASTAYRGDRGKTAYDHSQLASGNPHNVSASDVGLGNVANERQYSAQNPPPLPTPADIGAATAQDLTDHVGNTNNPHSVTAAQVGLDQVANERQYSANNPPPAPDAEDVPYDNTQSGLAATNVQDAIDEVYDEIPSVPSAYTSNPVMDGTASPGSSGAWAKGDHVHPSDTSKANQSQLAYVETGTTASRTYALGEYFCLNGYLRKATSAISQGATITDNNSTQIAGGGMSVLAESRLFKQIGYWSSGSKTITIPRGYGARFYLFGSTISAYNAFLIAASDGSGNVQYTPILQGTGISFSTGTGTLTATLQSSGNAVVILEMPFIYDHYSTVS